MAPKEIVRLNHVKMQFGDFVVHRDISFTVHESEVLTILGPSGTGKTVILKIIAALLQPTSGQVFVMQKDLDLLSESELVDLRGQIGMLFQGAALFDSLSVYENIAYPLREKEGITEEEIAAVVREKLEIIGLPEVSQKFPPELSGGQKKRVGLARALASSPRIMLFDEPTTGLDPTATRSIGDLILKLKQKFGITSLMVTHDIETARRVSDRWILLNEGHIIADGPVEQLVRDNQQVIEFIEGRWQDD